MEEFTAYTVERIKGKKQLVFNISCDIVFNSFKTLKYAQRSKAIEDAYHSQEITN